MRHLFHTALLGSLIFAAPALAQPPVRTDQQPAPAVAQPGVEVQSRGPIHEAFAQPPGATPAPGPEVPKEPPPPIPELPPDHKPEGQNVQWVPGYWQWDGDRKDYLWVSGVYRDVPPGRQWVAGYWNRAADGNWQYVNGYWAGSRQAAQAQYVPEPPASVENGPSLPPPGDNSLYNPGSWIYRDERWVWQPGFYMAARPGRMWIGPRYQWTPAGCVFVDGYWDYPLEDRGLLFAPVAFTQPLWLQPGWCYRPSFVVDVAPLFDAFFIGPRHHYYFGNFFGPRYAGLGYRPWYAAGRFGDPLLGYYHWSHRGNPGWYAGLRQAYAGPRVGGPRLVTPLSQFRGSNVRLTTVSAQQLAVQQTRARAVQQASVTRRVNETSVAARTSVSRQLTSVSRGNPVGAPRSVATLRYPEIRSAQPVQRLPQVHNLQAPARSAAATPYAYRPTPSHASYTGNFHAGTASHYARPSATSGYHRAAPAPARHAAPAAGYHRSAPAPAHHGGGGGHGGGHHR